MSRFRCMLAIVLSLATTMPLRVVCAQDPAPKPKSPGGMGAGNMGMGGMGMYGPGEGPFQGPEVPPIVSHTDVLLMVTNSPLWINEKGEFRTTDFDVLSFFLQPDRLAEAAAEPGKYTVGFAPFSATRGGTVLGGLFVYCREERPPAEVKKVVALAEKLIEQALLQIYKTNMASLDEKVRRAEEQLDRARASAEKRQSDLQSLRTRLVQLDASPEGIDQQQNTLRQDRLKLRVELVGFKARREAIVKAVAEASDKLKAITDEQQRELSELSKIVDIREQQLSKLQQFLKQGAISISASELQQAELETSRARADLAERRRLIAQQAGSDQLGRLNQQLADVQIEMSAAEARIADIEQMLARLQSKEVLDLLAQYAQSTQQLEYARAEEKAAFEQLAEAKKTAESTPAPKVVEIRGPAAPK